MQQRGAAGSSYRQPQPHLSLRQARCSLGWWPHFHFRMSCCLPALPSNCQIQSVIYGNGLARAAGSEAICWETTAGQLSCINSSKCPHSLSPTDATSRGTHTAKGNGQPLPNAHTENIALMVQWPGAAHSASALITPSPPEHTGWLEWLEQGGAISSCHPF